MPLGPYEPIPPKVGNMQTRVKVSHINEVREALNNAVSTDEFDAVEETVTTNATAAASAAAETAADTAVDTKVAGLDLVEQVEVSNEALVAGGMVFSDGKRTWVEFGEDGTPTDWSLTLLQDAGVPVPEAVDNTAAVAYGIVFSDGKRAWLETTPAGAPTAWAAQQIAAAVDVDSGGYVVTAESAAGVLIHDTSTGDTVTVTGPGDYRNPRMAGGWAYYEDSDGVTWRADPATGDTRRLVASTALAAYGDSLTQWQPPISYPDSLSTLAGQTVANRGVSGATPGQVAALIGADPTLVTVSGGSIPASGSVSVTLDPVILTTNVPTQTGTLAGVHGTLAGGAAGPHTFTRTDAGDAVAVAAPAPFVTDWSVADRDVTILLWIGRNNLTTAQARTQEIVAALAPVHPRYLVIGMINATTETEGTNSHTQIVGHNVWGAATYGDRFLDIRPWLVDEAIYDLGLTPDATDLSNMAADAPPPQIMDDDIHPIDDVYPLIAQKVYERLQQKGWA